MKDHRPERTAVFVDQSGRRAKILTAAAVGAAIVVLALTLTLVSGALAGPELPPMGWLDTQGRQSVERSPAGSPVPSHGSERRRVLRASGTPRATATLVRRTTSTRGLPSRAPSSSPSARTRTTPSASQEPDVRISSSGRSTPAPPAATKIPESPKSPESPGTTVPAGETTRTPAPEPSTVQTLPQQPAQTPGTPQ